MIRTAQTRRSQRLVDGPFPLTETGATILAIALMLAGLAAPQPLTQLLLLALGCGALSAVTVVAGAQLLAQARRRDRRRIIASLIARDAVPAILTDAAAPCWNATPPRPTASA